jgi:hypothetical protein
MPKLSPHQTAPITQRRRLLLAGTAGALLPLTASVHAATTLTRLSITGPAAAVGGERLTFSVRAHYSNGSVRTVTGTWSSSDSAQRFQGATLATQAVADARSLTINVSYREGNVQRMASQPLTLLAAAPVVERLSGYSAGDNVSDGRWTGQAPSCANARARTNSHNTFLALESQWEVAFSVHGRGFGAAATGRAVEFVDAQGQAVGGVTVRVHQWSATRIDLRVRSTVALTQVSGGSVRVLRDAPLGRAVGQITAASLRVTGFISTISTRGYGQCTWLVSHLRLLNNLAVPANGASIYGSSDRRAIDRSYVPARHHVLVYGNAHVGYISEVVRRVESGTGASRTVTWTLRVAEMNAACDERTTSDERTFQITGAAGAERVTMNIGTRAGAAMVASHHYAA